ncbi:MAG: PQQ-like beta-propeller repeat protein [Thermoguttaceae bacterium]|nr:PQQ-like beta-propeller repeat protein [Thermoguttaceae bacterium]MDW8078914.1 PQQ-binding-like beta-propeller repeat protein [Thermoguttaceae bacterium]
MIYLGFLQPFALLAGLIGFADDEWPTLRHDLRRTARAEVAVLPPYKLAWVVAFEGETMPTHTEPIVAAGKVYVGTYQGRIHCLEASTGQKVWTIELPGAILHSPSVDKGVLYVPGTDGLWAVDAKTGGILWYRPGPPGGFCTSPAVIKDLVLCGARDGRFFAIESSAGKVVWEIQAGGPIRTTAAVDGDTVFFAAEDMHVYAVGIPDGRLKWKSAKLWGQSLRDYAPVVISGKVVVCSNPVLHFAEHIGADTAFLARQAGLPDSRWQTIDAFLRSEKIRGSPEQIRAEQEAIRQRLSREPWRRTFYILDAATGAESVIAPVLYTGGCAGVGNPPAATSDGRLVVIYRTAFSNFSLGVAPFVGVGLLNVGTGEIEPLFHAHGQQPPWNTFWGTADEAQSIMTAGELVYFCHQGTLSTFNLRTRELLPVAGRRDSWGGFANLPWVLNEWHGPARGCAAIAGDKIFWQTGSRLLAVQGRRALPERKAQ